MTSCQRDMLKPCTENREKGTDEWVGVETSSRRTSLFHHMNYCTRAYSKQSICYLLERSQQQQNSSQKNESESVQNKESTVRKIKENTRLDMAEEDKLSSRFLLQGLTAWELTGPACSRGYESIKHLMETVLPFQRQKGTVDIVLSCLDSNYLHLQATNTFSVV